MSSWDESKAKRRRGGPGGGQFAGFTTPPGEGHLDGNPPSEDETDAALLRDRLIRREENLYRDQPLRKNDLIARYSERYPYYLQDNPSMDSHMAVTLALVNTGRYTVDDAEWHIGHANIGEPRDIAEEHPDGCVIEGRITRHRDGRTSLTYAMTYPRAESAVSELQRRGIERETLKTVRSRLENREQETTIVNVATVRPADDGEGYVIEPPPGKSVIGDAR